MGSNPIRDTKKINTMGLDMYLYKKSYLQTGEWVKPEYRAELTLSIGGVTRPSERIKYVVEEVAYWRKANQIHKWFVDNCQDGKDDCGEYHVTKEQLNKLISVCEYVLENKNDAEKMLPASSGFFFGGTDYDEYYFSDLEETIKMLKEALADESLMGEFYYVSSW